jgi:hypothetical protein
MSREVNLCLSLTHIYELLHADDANERQAMAAWLDEQRVVWLAPEHEVRRRELAHLLVETVRGRCGPPPIPTVPSFLSVFGGWESRALANALRNPTIAALQRELTADETTMRNLDSFRRLSIETAKDLYIDRSLALRENTQEAIERRLDEKLRAGLLEEGCAVAEALRNDSSSGFFGDSSGVLAPPNDEFVASTVRGLTDWKRLPYVFLWHRVNRNMSFEVTRRRSIRSRRFQEQRGDYYDGAHLVGGAYCDVFTCDAEVARRLSRGRELLGRAPPIDGRGGVEAVLASLQSQLSR